jgi:hypothetical protein
MHLRFNGLPFLFFPNAHFLWTYMGIAVILYGTPILWLIIKQRREGGRC